MGAETTYAFAVGDTTFVAMNAFDEPRPDAFVVSDAQVAWLGEELAKAGAPKWSCSTATRAN